MSLGPVILITLFQSMALFAGFITTTQPTLSRIITAFATVGAVTLVIKLDNQ